MMHEDVRVSGTGDNHMSTRRLQPLVNQSGGQSIPAGEMNSGELG